MSQLSQSDFPVALQALQAGLARLSDGDQKFARDLISASRSQRGASDKQKFWVVKLANRVLSPTGETAPAPRADLSGVIALLDRAADHLKHPALLVLVDGRTLRLSVAGARSSAPGTLNVTTSGSFDDRTWFGRVHRDGRYEASRGIDDTTSTAIHAALVALGRDPAKAAADYGHMTGVCCFCGIRLTDERSTEVGYGPICADHYGLPWGAKRAAA